MTDKRFYRSLVELGAQARLVELETERQRIYAAFPDLKPPGGRPKKMNAHPKHHSRMSRAARKLISQRMRAYWAKRNASKSTETNA